jgi:type II secretory pathway pseudopilin PulG
MTSRNRRPRRGFTRIELLGVIASIAIPNLLASKRAANEGSAVSSLRTIHSAQVTYEYTTGNGAYAATLIALGGQNLIDGSLSAGKKSGYDFAIIDQGGSGATAVFGAYAFPTTASGVGKTGTRVFGITESGVIRVDTDLTAAPATRADINALPLLGS